MRESEFFALSKSHNDVVKFIDEYVTKNDYANHEARLYAKTVVEILSKYVPFFAIFFRHFLIKKALMAKRYEEQKLAFEKTKVA